MDKKIKQILKDIYSIDESLKGQEEYLVKVIQELLLSNPENKIDEVFVSSLKTKLMEEVKLLKGEKEMPKSSFSNFSYAFAGTAVVLLAIISFVNFLPEQGIQLAVDKERDNAFGNITFSSEAPAEENGEKSSIPSQTLGMGGSESYSVDDVRVSSASTDGITEMIAPDSWVNINYIYSGEDFDVEGGKVTVYKKNKGTPDSLSSLLSGLEFSDVDISKFSNLEVESIQISENKDFGYTLYAYPKENTLYISQNWEKWPGYSYEREESSSVKQLPNSQVISIADKFVSNYNLNLSGFGPGEVIEYANMEESVMESATVVYPLQIEGTDVYSQSGYKNGLNVIVDFRAERVSNVSNINAGTFQGSDYDSNLSKEEIIAYAQKGGLQGNYKFENAQKTIDVSLGTPIYGLVQTWKQEGNSSLELFVPSLIFPVENIEDYEYYYGKSVVVPLVGEMMNQDLPVKIMEEGL